MTLKDDPTRKRKLLPPDGKPVELSVCAKLCHELFIDLNNSNASIKFKQVCEEATAQIDAFLFLTEEVNEELKNQKLPNKNDNIS